jgi:hypothetical protein
VAVSASEQILEAGSVEASVVEIETGIDVVAQEVTPSI